MLELSRSENHILGESVEIQADNQPSSGTYIISDFIFQMKMKSLRNNPKLGSNLNQQVMLTLEVVMANLINPPIMVIMKCQTNLGRYLYFACHFKSNDVEYDVDEMGDENVSTLQLAWEVVEVAKKIFMRNDDAQHRLKVSDCLEKLAEIGQEVGNYEQALSDLLVIKFLVVSHF